MTIIDSQVHAYEANTPKRPWHSVPNWPDHVTGDEMVATMDKVGVDGAIFISAFSMYQYDASYAVEVEKAHPDRFAIVKPVNPDDPAVADVIADWKKNAGRGRHPHHADRGGEPRAGRSRPRPDRPRGRSR
jgi:L-fuconolactonase